MKTTIGQRKLVGQGGDENYDSEDWEDKKHQNDDKQRRESGKETMMGKGQRLDG